MSTDETSRFVRLQVELVVEVSDPGDLTGAALAHIAGDDFMPDEERGHAESSVRADGAEALAYLIDPADLVKGVPGVELAQASWSSEGIDDYDPDSAEWDLEDDGEDESDGEEAGSPARV
ncbi:hypothetical protein [Streptomyces sp. H27-D2]|uniref:hypothetical protein n=1 Tax=Streptomyces sp. H27-D2 TaxID=3046304 RepID=UPI002DBFCD91|nr:hypothetical protein [Streptomyces sp. H27-D2]MEC4020999.1 hypothetical protein [Streptomyces sp. H27-D2]